MPTLGEKTAVMLRMAIGILFLTACTTQGSRAIIEFNEKDSGIIRNNIIIPYKQAMLWSGEKLKLNEILNKFGEPSQLNWHTVSGIKIKEGMIVYKCNEGNWFLCGRIRGDEPVLLRTTEIF